VRYAEIDGKGEAVDQATSTIGTLYLRKSALEPGVPFPQFLRVLIITTVEGLIQK
jgi:hypothetical protein